MCGERNQYVDKILNQLEHKIQNMMPIWTDQLKKCQLKLCLCFFQNGSWLSAVQRIHKGSPCVTKWKFFLTHCGKKEKKNKSGRGTNIYFAHKSLKALWVFPDCPVWIKLHSNLFAFLDFPYNENVSCNVPFIQSVFKSGNKIKEGLFCRAKNLIIGDRNFTQVWRV